MTFGDELELIRILGTIGWELYFWPSVAIQWMRMFGHEPPSLLRTIRAELRPFSLALALAYAVPGVLDRPSVWTYGTLGFTLLNWLLVRNIRDEDDDDRWKRRRQKLADKVAEVGGKLQVVPAGAS